MVCRPAFSDSFSLQTSEKHLHVTGWSPLELLVRHLVACRRARYTSSLQTQRKKGSTAGISGIGCRVSGFATQPVSCKCWLWHWRLEFDFRRQPCLFTCDLPCIYHVDLRQVLRVLGGSRGPIPSSREYSHPLPLRQTIEALEAELL